MIEEENKNLNNDTNPLDKKGEDWWRPAVFFYTKVTSWIIVPLIIAFFAGKFVTKSTGSQFLFFVFVFIAFCITCYGIYREIKIYKKELENDDKSS